MMDDDQQVIHRVLAGEKDAFRLLVRKHSLMLRGYLASQVYNNADVDDLSQEAFIIAFRKLNTLLPGTDFGAWLRGIARNQVLHHWRQAYRKNIAAEEFREAIKQVISSDLDAAFKDKTTESIEALLRCISRLPDRMRSVIRAGLDGNKPESIASEMATSVAAIYNLHYRANAILRDCVRSELQ